ncbi:MAG: calcium/sodium antiporter [Pseudomonadota bacterium]
MIWQLLIGLVLMLAGGEALVRGAVALAERLGVSPLVIGVTLIGFGTSAPELATCIDAILVGAPGIVVGNVIGSNIANVLLILAIGALIHPIMANAKDLRRDGPVLIASALVCVVIVMVGEIGRGLGGMLVLGLIAYLGLTALRERRDVHADVDTDQQQPDAAEVKASSSVPFSLMLTVLGLGGVLLGAHWLVEGAVAIATRFGISQAVIGLTLVAIGTSLPELATAIVASLKRQGALVFGNVIGSNIFNSLGIFGVTAIVRPIEVPFGLAGFDIWVMVGATAALLAVAVTGWRISRREGAALLIAYVTYLGIHAGAIAS